jgi:Flp pilus assembly protein CpaB
LLRQLLFPVDVGVSNFEEDFRPTVRSPAALSSTALESPDSPPGDDQRVDRTVGLPRGVTKRAALGAFLVCLSAATTLWAWTVRPDPRASYVVAAKALSPGGVVRRSHLRLAKMQIPPELARLSYSDPLALEGAIAVVGLEPGQLVQASDLVRPGPRTAGTREMSFSLSRDRALAGDLVAGELVDIVYAQKKDDIHDQGARWITRGARIVSVHDSTGIARSDEVVVTVAVRDDATLLSLAGAVEDENVRIVRSVGEARP